MPSSVTLRSLLVCAPLGLASWYATSACAAEPSTEQVSDAARALFAEGRNLVASGSYEQACPKFEQSLKQKVGIGTQFNLADCWEHVGRIASAYELFLAAADNARSAGQPERDQAARDRATLLEPRVSRLIISIDESEPELVVTRGQAPVERATWGVATPIDPGTYTIRATAPEKEPWSTQIEVTAEGTSISVHVPALKLKAKPALRLAAIEAPEPARHPVRAHPDNRTIITLALGALGVSGLVSGTVFGLHYQSTNARAAAICPASVDCTSAQVTSHDSFLSDARQARNLSFVSFGVGAMSLVTGAAFYLRSDTGAQRASWTAGPAISAGGSIGAAAQGRF
jgi:hypothetical protein